MSSERILRNYDDIPIVRSYDREVVQRLGRCRGISIEEIGRVQYGSYRYPLLQIGRASCRERV